MYKSILVLCLCFTLSCREHEPYSLNNVRGLEDCIAIYAPYPLASTVVRCKGSTATVITRQNKRNVLVSVIEPTDDNIEIKHIKETNAN
jgi:hypothetical protein